MCAHGKEMLWASSTSKQMLPTAPSSRVQHTLGTHQNTVVAVKVEVVSAARGRGGRADACQPMRACRYEYSYACFLFSLL